MATRTNSTSSSTSSGTGGSTSTGSAASAAGGTGATVIGSSVQVRGTVSGDEDLQVFGRIEGRVELQRTLLVEDSGVVKAEVYVKTAMVFGVVVGNIQASDAVHLLHGARMVGDIAAPRVIIADGASFRGGIDMGDMDAPVARKVSSERVQSAGPQRFGAPPAAPAAATLKPRPAVSAPLSPPSSSVSSSSSPAPSRAPSASLAPAVSGAPPAAVAAKPGEARPADKTPEASRPASPAARPAAPSAPLEAPAARGLPEKANKARVIVKRK